MDVAPFAGARVETYPHDVGDFSRCVAPFAGARVETYAALDAQASIKVAPFAGARVETPKDIIAIAKNLSRSLRGSAS